jgi:hypothetical protein
MNKWRPTTEGEIWDDINASWKRMNCAQRNLWEAIQIDPVKWEQTPWGDMGGGFWVVGIMGKQVLWYNDIEGGWNRSNYSIYGKINDYWCNQDELEWQLQHLIDEIKVGHPSGGRAGPPKPIS